MNFVIVRAVLLSTAAVALSASIASAQSAVPSTSIPPAEPSPAKTPKLPPVIVQQKTAAPSIGPTASTSKKPTSTVATEPAAEATPVVGEPPLPTSIAVGGQGLGVPAASTTLSGETIAVHRPATSDTARLLSTSPGVSIYQAGGVSSLPAINGLADDRVKILVNGMAVTSACANHMNPPLSYGDPSMVGAIEVTGGVTPVSKGGDSIAGTIIVEQPLPRFATAAEAHRAWGQISTFYRSNNHGVATTATAEAATRNFSMRYDGSWTQANDYHRGGGLIVHSTEYEARNHAVTLSARDGSDLFTVRAAIQEIPYQAFVNQYMDMGGSSASALGNKAVQFDTRYRGHFGIALVDATAFFHHVNHYMNKLPDKGGSTDTTGMPMFTDGKDFGYGIKVELPATSNSRIRLGNELHLQRYDEWWPGMAMMAPMMGPNDFWNIHDGQRDRLGTFAEWETKWAGAWTTLLGLRNDIVWMDAGIVQGYSAMMYGADAASFNARDHNRTDINFDATALVRFEPDLNSTYETGYARKTRSPNLYERYAWSTNSMAMKMIGWFGDLNGYIGNLDLKPEIAHTASFTAGWHDSARSEWEFKVTPYFTYVEDFIDVDTLRTTGSGATTVAFLRFANHNARLYGVNLSGQMPLWTSPDAGRFALSGLLGYVNGERTDGSSLYHMMPVNGRIALTHRLGGWSSIAEVQLVGSKTDVDARRIEPTTSAYALVNLRTSYDWQNVRFDLGVENLLDKLYYEPLGGRDYEGRVPVAGMGRSINAGVTLKF